MNKKFLYIAITGLLIPNFAFANSLDFIIAKAGDWISTLTPIVVALALLYFFWGLANFILKSGEDKEKGRDIMIHGIVALFVMVAVWGLVSLLVVSFGITGPQGGGFDIPKLIAP